MKRMLEEFANGNILPNLGVDMDNHMHTVTVDFVAERINYHSENETERLDKANNSFYDVTVRLQETLTKEQSDIYRDCEVAYSELDAETMHFYYEAGFGDAVRFIMGWKEGVFQKSTNM